MRDDSEVTKVERGIRLDLTIAVCALLISTLAAGASWWQARVLTAQTKVLQEQLGAQVWPFVSVSEGLNGNTAQISVTNDGLGPAIIRSVSAKVDGIPQTSFIGILHAILGLNLIARTPQGQRISIAIDDASPGAVSRPGQTAIQYALTSNRFALAFLQGSRRLSFSICYCAIIPGKCWLSDSPPKRDPQPVAVCPEVPHDLLHASAIDEVLDRKY